MKMIRYDDMRVDRLLIKAYQRQLEKDIRAVEGLNDIDRLLADFEQIFARYIGTRYALAVNSGSDALRLALLALGVGKGDSVLVPNICYPATALAVIYAGAVPIFVDAGDDLEINVELLQKKCRKDTRAIIAAHMFARPCAMMPILDFSRRRGIKVIEDCCQAESSSLDGKRLGSFGDAACFSFSYYKPLSSCGGGGGMVCFNDPFLLSMVKYTQVYGGGHELVQGGQRFARMSLADLSAVKAKWLYLKDIIKSRLSARKIYEKGLEGMRGVRLFVDPPGVVSVPQNVVVLLKERQKMAEVFRKAGIVWQRPYMPLHQMEALSAFAKGEFPVSDRYAKEAMHLPLVSFMDFDDVRRVVDVMRRFFKTSEGL